MCWSRSHLEAVKYKKPHPAISMGSVWPASCNNLQIIFSSNWSINLDIFQILDFLLGRNFREENTDCCTLIELCWADPSFIFVHCKLVCLQLRLTWGLFLNCSENIPAWCSSPTPWLWCHCQRAPSISHYIQYSAFLNGCQYLTVTLLTATILCIQPS